MSALALSEPIAEALNAQANNELIASNIYLAFSHWFALNSFPGSAHWMRVQALEERDHALKIFDHIIKRGSATSITSAPAFSTAPFTTPLEIWKKVVELEALTSKQIVDLMDLVQKDHATYAFLTWFVNEQVEEEDSVKELYDKVQAMSKMGGLYYHVDHELARRQ